MASSARPTSFIYVVFFFIFFFAANPIQCRLLSPASDVTHTFSFSYHGGPLLHGPIALHILWYGSFSSAQQSIITDFLSSFYPPSPLLSPSVPLWWNITSLYSSSSSPQLLLGRQAAIADPSASHGFSLNKSSIPALLHEALASGVLPTSARAIYMIFTSEDVAVEGFCMGGCGRHADMEVKMKKEKSRTTVQRVAYMWVGNAGRQCPGECAWPFAEAEYGPRGERPLKAPNGDVGVEGMVITIASLLAGTVTNPFNTGFFQGDARNAAEAGSACAGLFGEGAFPGFPGRLLKNQASGASFNVHGFNNRSFLVPALWNPLLSSCITLP